MYQLKSIVLFVVVGVSVSQYSGHLGFDYNAANPYPGSAQGHYPTGPNAQLPYAHYLGAQQHQQPQQYQYQPQVQQTIAYQQPQVLYQQAQTYEQPQAYHQPQVFQQPQAYHQQPQAYHQQQPIQIAQAYQQSQNQQQNVHPIQEINNDIAKTLFTPDNGHTAPATAGQIENYQKALDEEKGLVSSTTEAPKQNEKQASKSGGTAQGYVNVQFGPNKGYKYEFNLK